MVRCSIYIAVSTSSIVKSVLNFIMLLYSHPFLTHRSIILDESVFVER